jgi:hypothetical protein
VLRFLKSYRFSLLLALLTVSLGGLFIVFAGAQAQVVESLTNRQGMSDAIDLPPQSREIFSPRRNISARVFSEDQWKLRIATLEVFANDGAKKTLLWRVQLPHPNGPRFVTVLDSGAVVLIDDWINSPSRQALMVLTPSGKALATYSFEDIVAVLSVSRREVANLAKIGLWQSASADLGQDGKTLLLYSAKKILDLNLIDGSLRLRQ